MKHIGMFITGLVILAVLFGFLGATVALISALAAHFGIDEQMLFWLVGFTAIGAYPIGAYLWDKL